MKLTHVRVKDFRSFSGEHEFDASSGVNYFGGPNNCGKSKLVRALELALDPDAKYVPERNRPARPGAVEAPPTARITLTFHVGKTSPEVTLLRRAKDCERAVRKAWKGKAACCADDQSRAELIGSLYRDAGMAGVLERALTIPGGPRAVVITEGYTDGEFLRVACEAAARGELDGIHITSAGGVKRVVCQAILARSATEKPVIAILDHDGQGRAAISKLEDFGWAKSKDLVTLAAWPDRCPKGHDAEIENLIPSSLWEDVIKRISELEAIPSHFCIESIGLMKPAHTKPLVWLPEEINARIAKIEKAAAAAKAHAEASAES